MPATSDALYDARGLPGVQYAEPVFGLAADLRFGRASRRVAITGLEPGHRLTTPLDHRDLPIVIPPSGLLLSEKLAELLDARVGDRLELTPVLGQRLPRQVPVAAIAHEYMGANAYADIGYLSRLVGEPLDNQLHSDDRRTNPPRRPLRGRQADCPTSAASTSAAR